MGQKLRLNKAYPAPYRRKHFTIKARTYPLHVGTKTLIMGILNMTPDSFSLDGCLKTNSSFKHLQKALNQAKKMIKEGADIIDIGGESSRPGANRISIKEESSRVIPIIEKLTKTNKTPISIDTYKSQVAQKALDAGACIVNNIMGVDLDKKLLKMVRDYDAAIVLMHIKGKPKTMQRHVAYNDVIGEIIKQLQKSIENCLEIGIKSDRIIIDPGIGFGKSIEHNLQIINRLQHFQTLNQPLLMGTSRKSFIGKVLDLDVNKRLNGTLSSVCASILNGAHIVRVHDVAHVKQTATMADAIINEKIIEES